MSSRVHYLLIYIIAKRRLPLIDPLFSAERIELALKALEVLGVLGIRHYIMEFVRVFLQVIKLIVGVGILRPVEMQEFVSPVAHAIMAHHIVLGRAIVVVIVEILAPVLRSLPFVAHDRKQRGAHHLLWLLGICNVEESGGKVDVLHKSIARLATLHARRTDE